MYGVMAAAQVYQQVMLINAVQRDESLWEDVPSKFILHSSFNTEFIFRF